MKKAMGVTIICTALVLCMCLPTAVQAEEIIKIGSLATLEGPFAVLGQDGIRGIKLALQQWNYTAGGKKIKLSIMSTDATPDSATGAVRKLVEQDKVDIVIGPLSGSEGIAVKDYAHTQPQVTFFNGISAAQDTTLRNPAPNFFRFTGDGVQWMAGTGEYVVQVKGYKKIVTIAEDYSFAYTNVLGFLLGYCKAGGKVLKRFWVPVGNKDYSAVVASIPDDIDAIFVALGGSDAINFLTQYEQAGGDKPMVGGSVTVDQSVMGSKGRLKKYMIGTPSGSALADSWDDPRWKKLVAGYRTAFPKGFPSPSIFAWGYYVSTLACLTGLDKVNGDLSDNHKAYREALSNLVLDTPTGTVRLDENRQAIADIFVTEVAEGADGKLYSKVVKIIPQVNQTLGMDRAEFLGLGPVGRDNPPCK